MSGLLRKNNQVSRTLRAARRIAGGKLFFGEDFSYDGKVWNPKLGFVKKGGK